MTSAATTPHPSSADPLVAVQGLSKRFPVAWDFFGRATKWVSAVDDVSLDVRQGETLALVGESGSGKSTLARLVLRLIDASSGSVRFHGEDVLALSAKELRHFRQQAQIIFQDPFDSLDPRMKATAIVAEGMGHLGLGKQAQKARVAELLHLVHLPTDAGERFPHEFSGGQRQRLSIARALAVDPTFIVADEPVSALDVSMQSQILNLMRELQDRLGLTYLFISHDMSVVRHMADRVAVMYLGKLVEVAPAEELFRNPLHPYTQALLSSVPSLLKGRPAGRIHLPGEASMIDARPACRFAGRCFRALDLCRQEVPPLEPIAPGSDHWVACFNSAPMPADLAVA
ncbi:MAG: peptide/nickel transport system ATP-binding protein [Thermomicrobiales bacterium]|nr:peptide/nickel transport system ATP-binding protein [Thermomicrobiales bacterium]